MDNEKDVRQYEFDNVVLMSIFQQKFSHKFRFHLSIHKQMDVHQYVFSNVFSC